MVAPTDRRTIVVALQANPSICDDFSYYILIFALSRDVKTYFLYFKFSQCSNSRLLSGKLLMRIYEIPFGIPLQLARSLRHQLIFTIYLFVSFYAPFREI